MEFSVAIGLLVVTVAISVMAWRNAALMDRLHFHPFSIINRKRWWQLWTYGFVHADGFHLFVNAYVLFLFGPHVEEVLELYKPGLGGILFLALYLGGLAGAVLPALEREKAHPGYAAVGASGAISALLFSSILFEPLNSFYLMFIPIPIPAWIFGLLYLLFEYSMARRGGSTIGHDAHLFGALTGMLITLLIEPSALSQCWQAITGRG